jgi:two-component system response regulator VicR
MKSFSSGEVAKICDVNPRTVIRWIEAKKLKAFKLPGRGNNRVKHSDLLDFLVQNKSISMVLSQGLKLHNINRR